MNRRPDIQGLRAIAVGAVIAFHAGLPIPGGFTGVDVFFVISGFVITRSLHSEWQRTGTLKFRQFYVRRFKRLTPALGTLVAVTIAVSAFLLSPLGPQQVAANTGIGAMLLVANIVIERTTGGYFDAPAEINPLLNTWSLSVEEQFYLIFPALLFIAWAITRKARAKSFPVYSAIMLVIGLSFGLAVLNSYGIRFRGIGSFMGFYSAVPRAWEFAIGALVLLVLAKRKALPRFVSQTAGILGIALLALSFFAINERTPFPGVWTLLPVVGAALVVIAGSGASSIVTRSLSFAPLARVGDWSYSLYLWHWPLIVFALLLWPSVPGIAALAALASFVPAILSFSRIEQPIRALTRPSRRQWWGLIGGFVALPIAIALCVRAVDVLYWEPRFAPLISSTQPHANYEEGCFWSPEDGPLDPAPCRWNAEAPGTPIYLIGDSNAAHFSEGVRDAGVSLQSPVTINTSSGCPALGLAIERPELPGVANACKERSNRLIDWLRGEPRGVVILASTDEYWLNPGYAVNGGSNVATSVAERTVAYASALETTVTRLKQAGHQVLLMQSIPHFQGGDWDTSRYTLPQLLAGGTTSMPLSTALSQSAEVRAVVTSVADKTGSPVLDVSGIVCPGQTCMNATSTKVIYSDPGHITAGESASLAPDFARALTPLVSARTVRRNRACGEFGAPRQSLCRPDEPAAA